MNIWCNWYSRLWARKFPFHWPDGSTENSMEKKMSGFKAERRYHIQDWISLFWLWIHIYERRIPIRYIICYLQSAVWQHELPKVGLDVDTRTSENMLNALCVCFSHYPVVFNPWWPMDIPNINVPKTLYVNICIATRHGCFFPLFWMYRMAYISRAY
jgi:hypothetical protein